MNYCPHCGRGTFGIVCDKYPYCAQRAQRRTVAVGIAVRCCGCDATITLDDTAIGSRMLLLHALRLQGVTTGPVNPITGYVPIRCAACTATAKAEVCAVEVRAVEFAPVPGKTGT